MSTMRRFSCLLLLVVVITVPVARGALAPGPDGFGYSVTSSVAFVFTNITATGTKVLNFNDDTAITVNLGFGFNFYGSNYTAVSFNPNGLLTFGGASEEFSNVNLATTSPSNDLPAIAVLWDDYDTQIPGADAVYYKTIDSPGSRQFILQWNDMVLVQGQGLDPVTFELRFFEESNQILFSYLDVIVADDPAYNRGAFATVGIRDRGGHTNNRALLWSHNQPAVSNGLNLLFSATNHPPTAVDDVALTRESVPVVVPVLANDSDLDGNPLSLISVSNGAHGSTVTNANGTVSYTPMTNFFGADSFNYTVADGRGGNTTGMVMVTVWPALRIETISLLVDAVRLEFGSIPSRIYEVEGSEDSLEWEILGAAEEEMPGTFAFEDPRAGLPPVRFYRLRER